MDVFPFKEQSPSEMVVILALGFLIVPIAVFIAVISDTSLIWPLGLWAFLSLVILYARFRFSFLDVFFFLLPLVRSGISSLLMVPRNWVALCLIFLFFSYCFVDRCNSGWQQEPIRTPYSPFLIVFSFLFIPSLFANPMHERALSFLTQTLPLVAVYWIISQLLVGKSLPRLLKAFILGSVANASIFMIAFLGSNTKMFMQGYLYGMMRPLVLGENANTWPYTAVMGSVIILSFLIYGKVRRIDQLWMVPALLLLLAVIVINMSRTAILGFLVSTVFLMATHPRSRKVLIYFLVLLNLTLIPILPYIWPKIEILFRFYRGLSGREYLWPLAWQILEDHVLLGIGPANFQGLLCLVAPLMPNGLSLVAGGPSAHNIWLHVGVEIGLLAPIVMLLMVLYFAARSKKLWFKLISSDQFPVLVAICAVVIFGFVRSIFESDFIIRPGNLANNLMIIVIFAIQYQLAVRSNPAA